MAEVLVEICVDDMAGLDEAVAGGAGRIELCSALGLGGLTPSEGFMRAAAGCGVPVFAMIRPRAGDFAFSRAEVAVMERDIDRARKAGLAGVVLGAGLPDGTLDGAVLARLAKASEGMGRTLHRAFDLVPDFDAALETAVGLGFDRILTSGGARKATEGVAVLDRLFRRAAGRIGIMPGSGVTAATVAALRHLPLREIHASCARPVAADARLSWFGFAPPEARRTARAEVAALRAALDG
ncbi:MAG: copper homeostasis protein CutC [Paracoccaceae bacterium]